MNLPDALPPDHREHVDVHHREHRHVHHRGHRAQAVRPEALFDTVPTAL